MVRWGGCLARAPRSHLSGVVRCNTSAPVGWYAVRLDPQWSRVLRRSVPAGWCAGGAASRGRLPRDLARAPRSHLSGVVRCNTSAPVGWCAVGFDPQWSRVLRRSSPAGWCAVTTRLQWGRALWDSASVGWCAVARAGAPGLSGHIRCGTPALALYVLNLARAPRPDMEISRRTPPRPPENVRKRPSQKKIGRFAAGAPEAPTPPAPLARARPKGAAP